MTRSEKTQLIAELTDSLSQARGFYLIQPGPLNAAETLNLRRQLYEKGLRLRFVKNTLLAKAIERWGRCALEPFHSALQQSTALILYQGDPKVPAQVLEDFQKKSGKPFPVLKAAYVEDMVFVGENALAELTRIKSKQDLLAEVLSQLQAPLHRLTQSLQQAGITLHGILQALSERKS
ncbi:MAG: 50S ribosomal protein L10 [Bacteroidia bacterium]